MPLAGEIMEISVESTHKVLPDFPSSRVKCNQGTEPSQFPHRAFTTCSHFPATMRARVGEGQQDS